MFQHLSRRASIEILIDFDKYFLSSWTTNLLRNVPFCCLFPISSSSCAKSPSAIDIVLGRCGSFRIPFAHGNPYGSFTNTFTPFSESVGHPLLLIVITWESCRLECVLKLHNWHLQSSLAKLKHTLPKTNRRHINRRIPLLPQDPEFG